MFAAAMMAAGASGASTCSSVKLVGPWSTVPQTNWIRNLAGGSEATGGGLNLGERRRNCGFGRDRAARPTSDDEGYPPPVSRRLVAIGLPFAAPRFPIGLIAKFVHEQARDGSHPLGPLELQQQPRKHIRPLGRDAGARLGMRALTTARR